MKKQTRSGVQMQTNVVKTKSKCRCFADALTATPRCPWPPIDRFIVCLERICSAFTAALGAELRVTSRDPTCESALTREWVQAPGGWAAGRPANRADHPRTTLTRVTAHSHSGVPPLPPRPSPPSPPPGASRAVARCPTHRSLNL